MSAAWQADYHPSVVELFAHLHHAGSLAGDAYAVRGEAGSRARGASVRLWLLVRENKIAAARFEAYGCPHFLAAVEMLCRWLEGRRRAELDAWQWREWEAALAVPTEKRNRLLILEDALRRAAAAWDHFISAKVSATQSEM